MAALALLGCLLPVPAAAYVDYGFSVVDNSAGGSIMDNYITQELWADTDLQWTGTQLRLELDSGTIFQDTAGGSGFIAESNHELLADALDQPSLAFDTRVGLNGAPPLLVGGAINVEGSRGIQFTDTILDITFGQSGGEYHTGAFDFGTFTLSQDAVGHGVVMFSMHGEHVMNRVTEGGHYAQTFEINQGVIRLTGERVNLEDPNYTYSLEDWQYVRHEIPPPLPEPEPEPEPPMPEAPVVPIDPPQVELPPVREPDPMPQPEPLPEPIEDPAEPLPYPGDPILFPSNPVCRVIEFPDVVMPGGPIDDLLRLPVQLPYIIDFDSGVLIEHGIPVLTVLDEEFIQTNRGVTGFMELRQAFDNSPAQLLTTAVMGQSGELLFPLSALSDAQRTDLLDTGYWSLQGNYLLYSGPVGVPEPASIVLILLAAGVACCWRPRK